MSNEQILEDAFSSLDIASKCEENGNRIEAGTKYYEGCYLLRRYVSRLPVTAANEQTRDLINGKVAHFQLKGSKLLNNNGSTATAAFSDPRSPVSNPKSPHSKHSFFGDDDASVVPMVPAVPLGPSSAPPPPPPPPPPIASPRHSASVESTAITKQAGRADSCLATALDLDEAGRTQEAMREYVRAAELYLQSIRGAEQGGPALESVATFLKRRLEGALDRIEQLKNPTPKAIVKENKLRQKKAPAQALSEDEVTILTRSSLIASGLFLPWSEQDAADLCAQAAKPTIVKFTDKSGPLKLASQQKKLFHKWARPSEILQLRQMRHHKPTMIRSITPYTIRQKCVTDCSMIASLCVCAAFERRFQKRLITSIIYPQTSDGMPVINPSGKYMVKLWLNGVARQVVVDDLFPIDHNGNLLCSHTTTPGLELWVCIIEKAYMKMCGGYDFPGSNSGVDLFALTGWIPERFFFPKDPEKVKDHETPSERAWERLYSASSYGDCLISVSSSPEVTKERAEAVGLVVAHAYAVLRVLETRNGTRLLQLKNPWARKSWKGKYSSIDSISWADKSLCAEIGFDPVEAQKRDDGVFWISWDDILLFFQTIQLSWNPALFPSRISVHGFWPASQGPPLDTFNVGENPQYTLTPGDEAIRSKASIWVLLSRHVNKQEQEGSEVKDFLTTHIHRSSGRNDRAYYPGGKKCVLHGAYTNNPHVLIRYDLKDAADKNLALVLSQYQKSNDLGYTLSCFCTHPFTLVATAKALPFKLELQNDWTQFSAGGSPSNDSFGTNPMYAIRIPNDGATLQLRCMTTKSLALNIMLVKVEAYGRRVHRLTAEPLLDSGHYRFGFTVTETKRLARGDYTIIASTFNPGQTGRFHIQMFSSSKLSAELISG